MGAGSPTESEAITSEPRGDGEELIEDEAPDDPLRDLAADEEEVVDNHMDDSTVIYECIEKHIDALNNDKRLIPVVESEEKSLMDEALYCFEINPNRSKELIKAFLSTIIKPKPHRRSARNRPKAPQTLSKRKLKKKNYAEFQRR